MADRWKRKGVSSVWQKVVIIGLPACFVLIALFAFLYTLEAHRSDHFSQELVQCRGNLTQCRDESGNFERAAARYERAQRVLAFYDASTWMYKSVQLEWTPGYSATFGVCGASPCYEVRLTDFKTERGETPLLYLRLSNVKEPPAAQLSGSTDSAESAAALSELAPTSKHDFVLPLETGCRINVSTTEHELLFVIENSRENSSFLGIGVRIGGAKESFGTPVYTCPGRDAKLTTDLYKAPAAQKP